MAEQVITSSVDRRPLSNASITSNRVIIFVTDAMGSGVWLSCSYSNVPVDSSISTAPLALISNPSAVDGAVEVCHSSASVAKISSSGSSPDSCSYSQSARAQIGVNSRHSDSNQLSIRFIRVPSL